MRVESCRRVSAVWYDDIMYPYQDHLEWNRDVLYLLWDHFVAGKLSTLVCAIGVGVNCRC